MELPEIPLELVTKARGGDRVALTTLLTLVDQPVRQWISRRLPVTLQRVLDVDDVLQNAYADVFASIGRFEMRSADSFGRWVATIALRRLRVEIRRTRTRKRGGQHRQIESARNSDASTITLLRLIESGMDTPSAIVSAREARELATEALGELPPDYAEAVRLVHIEGFSAADAARRMGRSERAIHNLCLRARQRLRALLDSGARSANASESPDQRNSTSPKI